MARRLDPRPYVIAVACAANAGSAATLIGNPQNLMIAEFGQLDFTAFLWRGVPALIGLLIVYGVIGFGPMTRAAFDPVPNGSALDEGTAIILDRLMLIKAVAATLAVIAIFIFVEDRALWSLLIVAVLLLSRRLGTDQVLGRVDWHLLALFCGLFIVTGAMAGDDAIAAFSVMLYPGFGLIIRRCWHPFRLWAVTRLAMCRWS